MVQYVLMEFAFTPISWCYITDVEIFKRAGRINIEDMRLIQLMHPEYQINNKFVGKKDHQAGLLGLNKVLIGDIFRYTRKSGCYGMNDAKGFFTASNI